MKLINSYTLEIKKSKFIAYYYEINTQEEAENILNNLKIEHKNAKHIPYAYKLSNTAKKSDDKEPVGTAGNPIFSIILKNNLENVLIAVVRYFGGIKLGSSLLLRTYANVSKNVLIK